MSPLLTEQEAGMLTDLLADVDHIGGELVLWLLRNASQLTDMETGSLEFNWSAGEVKAAWRRHAKQPRRRLDGAGRLR